MKLNVAHVLPRSASNGPGERFVIWVQGCPLHCPGCWNPDTWTFKHRNIWNVDDLVHSILQTDGIEGVTFSGGEPFAQAKELTALARRVQSAGLSVFVFTGYTTDELVLPEHQELLEQIDVLVAGRFVNALKESGLLWRGSKNQTVHFLSSRYSNPHSVPPPELEILLDPDGAVTMTGFPEVQEWIYLHVETRSSKC